MYALFPETFGETLSHQAVALAATAVRKSPAMQCCSCSSALDSFITALMNGDTEMDKMFLSRRIRMQGYISQYFDYWPKLMKIRTTEQNCVTCSTSGHRREGAPPSFASGCTGG
jgi:hypothetical protein